MNCPNHSIVRFLIFPHRFAVIGAALATVLLAGVLSGMPSARATVITEYDSGLGIPLSPTTQGWTPSEIIEEGDPPPPTLATDVDDTGNPLLANAGAGATGWIVRDYLDGAPDGMDDRPEYNWDLTATDFGTMQSNGWSFTATFMMDSVDYGQAMRVLSMDQGGGNGLPFDIKVNATYFDAAPGGNLGLDILGGVGNVDTGVLAEQFNTVIFTDNDGNGSFTISVNGNLLDDGATFTSTPSSGDVPGDDILVFGANSTGGDGGGIEYDLLRLETGDTSLIVDATIDRDTGQVTITNNTSSARSIVGYSIRSAQGALDPGQWLSISDNYDASGDGSVDPNDEWVELTDPAERTDLSEFEPDGDGGTIAQSQTIDLGNGWIKNPVEEMIGELLLADGTVETMNVSFENGPNNAPFEFGDLDFDGDFDRDDFTGVFVPGFDADTSGMSEAERYQSGDFNADDVVDEIDFLIFNNAFLAANPGAASLSLPGVPEPSTTVLIALGGITILLRSGNRGGRFNLLVALVAALVCCQAEVASAQPASILAHWSFDETSGTTLADSTGNHNGTALDGLTASANPALIGNAWDFAGGYLEVANPGDFTSLPADYSFSMWFKTTSNGPAVMWSVSDSTVGSEEALVRINDFAPEGTQGGVHYMGRPNVSQAVSTAPTNNDRWHHVVATQSSDGWGLYVDGVLDKTGPQVHSPALIGADTVRIGQNVDSGGGQWGYSGLLDDISIWDAPLTAQEVGNLYLKGLVGIAAPDPFSAVLSMKVNRSTGEVLLQNDAGVTFEIDLYRVSSTDNSLDPNGWNSLAAQGFDSAAWTELGTETDKVSEGTFGDSTVLADGFSRSLGNLYNESVDSQDLIFEFHLAGTPATLLVEGAIDYMMDDFLQADFDRDGDVDGDDFLAWQGGFGTPSGAAKSDGDYDNDGDVDGDDFLGWQSEFGSGGGAGSAAVPEPPTALLGLLILTAGIIGFRIRRYGPITMAGLVAVLMAAPAVQADVHNDREYLLGDDLEEGALVGTVLGSGNQFSATFDSAGTPTVGDLQDLDVILGLPTYVDVSDRPGASAGALGAALDPANLDQLFTLISMNRPTDMWDSDAFFGTPTSFPHNYEGVLSHGIQLWAKPNSATQNVDQVVILDTLEHGIAITANNTWALWYDPDEGGLATNPEVDSGVPVAFDEWTHLMSLGGIRDPIGGTSAADGALLVNGVAIAAKAGTYDADGSELSVGSDQLGSDLFYHGILDDIRLFLWGDNSNAPIGPGGQVGQNWGRLNLGEDNDWIAQELANLGVTDVADVNLDGQVVGDGSGPAATDDVSAFVDGWLSIREMNGVQVGDWISRQNGDLNYDGITDLNDAWILHVGLVAGGGAGLDFSLLGGGTTPEPATCVIALIGCLTAIGMRRRTCRIRFD